MHPIAKGILYCIDRNIQSFRFRRFSQNDIFTIFQICGRSPEKVTKIIDWNLYCILQGISPVQWVILSQIQSVLATIYDEVI